MVGMCVRPCVCNITLFIAKIVTKQMQCKWYKSQPRERGAFGAINLREGFKKKFKKVIMIAFGSEPPPESNHQFFCN